MIGYGSQCARPWARVQAADLGLRPWRSVSLSPLLLIAPAFAGACVTLHDHHLDHERPARSTASGYLCVTFRLAGGFIANFRACPSERARDARRARRRLNKPRTRAAHWLLNSETRSFDSLSAEHWTECCVCCSDGG